MTSSTFRGGGGDRSRSRTHTLLHRLFYQYHTITKNLKYALVMKHQIYRLKVDGANLGIVGIVRPKLLSARLTQTIIRRRHSSCSGLTPALGKPCSLLDRLYFLFFFVIFSCYNQQCSNSSCLVGPSCHQRSTEDSSFRCKVNTVS